MRNRHVLPFLLLLGTALVTAAGCTTGMAQDILYPRQSGPYDRGAYEHDRYGDRVDRDARRYVAQVDRAVRLSDRQARELQHLLVDRTYALLDRVDRRQQRSLYPFPRQVDRQAPTPLRRWWKDTDRHIERRLSKGQRRVYREAVRRRDDRYRQRRRHDDRRHEDRRRDRRHDDDDDDDGRHDDDDDE